MICLSELSTAEYLSINQKLLKSEFLNPDYINLQ